MAALTNGVPSASTQPIELSFPLPDAPTTRVNLHLTNNTNSLLVFLTTSSTESSPGPATLGSFVYAMPNLANPAALPLTTALLPQTSSQDFANRVAVALARKVKKPVYVGSSVSFANTALGGDVAEEMRGLGRCIEVIVGVVEGRVASADTPA